MVTSRMNTPIAAVLWPEEAGRDIAALVRLMEHLEVACLDLGAEDAAAFLAEAATALLEAGRLRRRAA
jgi:hypothetical protein